MTICIYGGCVIIFGGCIVGTCWFDITLANWCLVLELGLAMSSTNICFIYFLYYPPLSLIIYLYRSHFFFVEVSMLRKSLLLAQPQWDIFFHPPPRQLGMKTAGKPLNRFLLLHLNTKTKAKAKALKPDTKTSTNLWNIKNFENELIRAKLCRTRSVYEKSIRKTKCITINKWIIINKSYHFLEKYLHSTRCKEDMIFLR
jgi:hypothetical protein